MKPTRQFLLCITMILCFGIVFFSEQPTFIKGTAATLYGAIALSICYVLMLENRSPYKTLLWIYAILFFPIIGYIFFIYSGQLQVKGHLFKQKRLHDYEQAQIMHHENRSSEKWTHLHESEREFSKLITALSNQTISFSSQTEILKNGDEKFPRLLQELQAATDFIHIEYYIFRSDRIGKEIIAVLCKKAKEGVEVRFSYDGIGSLTMSDGDISHLKESGVEVYSFLPIRKGFFNQKFNFRNHRKVVVIDGRIGFVGGLNVGDEYLGRNPDFGFWRDTHMLVKGEALRDLHRVFLLDWNYVSGDSLLTERYLSVQPAEDEGGVQIVPSGPDTSQGVMSYLYYSMITSAKKSVWIVTPYFIPSKEIRTALLIAAVKGIDVRVMVPEKNDGFLTQYATRSYFSELLQYGVKVYTYQKGFHHQKTIIVDESYATLGTANVDLRSFHLNFEVNVFMFRTPTVQTLVSHYLGDIKNAIEIDKEAHFKRGMAVRTKESFSRLFSPVL
ncbi:cardiolipin synthase [Alkalihalobacillus sp. AL-G]|uniref:cardiolipin synthase n=1 Tax=Alkalihalobacillus sp. AL-G TaxID=2926399 RepID=UPI00272BBA13|nr:cardiolipin synthase [Alkalihalobacillus sp. AL-G]WLD92753.1 cardiolipin synthase [Alkalihalobacillus sp. AL-G]